MITVVTAPSIEPVTLSEAKAHLRVDSDITAEDTLITALIKAARETAEGRTWRAFLEQTLLLTLDDWPEGDVIELPRPPLIEVDSVQYYDVDGVLQTMAEADYQVDATSEPGRVMPAYDGSWPSLREVPNAVQIQYTAGYGDEAGDVPQKLKQAILLILGAWYAQREEPEGSYQPPVPWAAEALLGSMAFRF